MVRKTIRISSFLLLLSIEIVMQGMQVKAMTPLPQDPENVDIIDRSMGFARLETLQGNIDFVFYVIAYNTEKEAYIDVYVMREKDANVYKSNWIKLKNWKVLRACSDDQTYIFTKRDFIYITDNAGEVDFEVINDGAIRTRVLTYFVENGDFTDWEYCEDE